MIKHAVVEIELVSGWMVVPTFLVHKKLLSKTILHSGSSTELSDTSDFIHLESDDYNQ